MEEQQRFKQRTEAYKARIQHLETQLSSLQSNADQQPAAAAVQLPDPHHAIPSAAPSSPKNAMPEGIDHQGAQLPALASPHSVPVGAREGTVPAGQSSPHSPSHSAARPSRQAMGENPSEAAMGALQAAQQHRAEARAVSERVGTIAAASLQDPPVQSGNPDGAGMHRGAGHSSGSPLSHVARALLHRAPDGGDEVTSRGRGLVLEASAEAREAAGSGGITAQLLASALAQAFAAMPPGALAAYLSILHSSPDEMFGTYSSARDAYTDFRPCE